MDVSHDMEDILEDQYDKIPEDMDMQDEEDEGPPVKIRKKPGRKPNPASPALRKAQNRAAQRAFRERKEKHLRELEVAIKQVREQRDKLHTENEQLKSDNDILKSENWYLKGIVLSLQLVCFQHNLTIPQHGPYINDQTLSVLAQAIPEPIASYLDVNAKSKLPTFSKVYNSHPRRQKRDRYVSSGSILITEDGVRSMPNRVRNAATSPVSWEQPTPPTTDSSNNSVDLNAPSPSPSTPARSDDQPRISLANLPDLSPVQDTHHEEPPRVPKPVMLTDEPLTSNLAAIQALRMRLRLQAACVRMSSLPFAIQPTLLQLTIPHDPRIDLIPTPHMRDRMILFRDQFSLDDCFRCLLSGSVFHGGDPAIAANWELPVEFFEKFWFLTIDFSLQRTTNRWRRMQGLEEVQPFSEDVQTTSTVTTVATTTQPSLEPTPRSQPQITITELSSFLGIELNRDKLTQQNTDYSYTPDPPTDKSITTTTPLSPPDRAAPTSYPSSLSSTCTSKSRSTTSSAENHGDEMFSPTPIQLTNGYYGMHYAPRNGAGQKTIRFNAPEQRCTTWDSLITNDNDGLS
ncbi:hypothetical protein BJV82DRAFT_532003 [Fennellomyces sp. T-0311]|nr:hypothetical protein BJV82DRAFT_532003 [Fennellomyces sp. T-0311]